MPSDFLRGAGPRSGGVPHLSFCAAVAVTLLGLSACRPAPVPTGPAEGGIHTFLWGNAATTDRDVKLAKDGGFKWIKQRFEWRNIERDAKGQLEWNEPDRIVKAIKDADLRIVARLDGHPGWSRAQGIFPDDGPPDRTSDWTDFLTALASRYKGRIDAYEVWNEPNLAREWGRRPPNAAEYVQLLKASYDAIKRADPQALVITAGLSPTTDISQNARSDVMYLRDMYAAGLKGSFDLLGVHGAGFKAAPETDPAVVANDPALTNNDPSPPELRRAYTFRHVEDLRQVMVEQGDQDKKIAVLEMGWTSDMRPNSPYRWHAVTEDEKADYLRRAFSFARDNWPWAAFMTVIYLPDPSWTRDQEQFYWAITNQDGSPRPAYTALRQVLTTPPARRSPV